MCDEALAELPDVDTLAQLARPPQLASDYSPADERARVAARVMVGERNALETCIAVWKSATTAATAA